MSETFHISALRPDQPTRYVIHGSDWVNGGLTEADVAAVLATIGFSTDDAIGVMAAAREAFPRPLAI